MQRHRDETDGLAMPRQAVRHRDRILGAGLGGLEVGSPPAKFSRAFAEARENGWHIVAHAGEGRTGRLCAGGGGVAPGGADRSWRAGRGGPRPHAHARRPPDSAHGLPAIQRHAAGVPRPRSPQPRRTTMPVASTQRPDDTFGESIRGAHQSGSIPGSRSRIYEHPTGHQRPAAITPCCRHIAAISTRGSASSNSKSATLPASTVPT